MLPWIARVPLPKSLLDRFDMSSTFSSPSGANLGTEEWVLRGLEQPPHCCAPADKAIVAFIPLRFTAALHGCRVRRADGTGVEALRAVYNATAAALHAYFLSTSTLGRPRPPVVVVASNAVAFDYLGAGFPWCYGLDGRPPPGIIRISPELRFRAIAVGASVGPERARLTGSRPWGYVGSSAHQRTRASTPSGRDPRFDLTVRTNATGISMAQLAIAGSGTVLSSAEHALVREFVTVPYGTVHGCQQHRRASRVRDILVAFWGCLPAELSYQYSSMLWMERIRLAGVLSPWIVPAGRRHPPSGLLKIVNTCARQRVAGLPGPRSFELDDAFSTYSRSLVCLVPSGDAVSSSRLFDVLAHGCIPLVTNVGVVLPYAAELDWDACILWHRVDSADDARTLLLYVKSLLALNATGGLQPRQAACARLRNAVLFFAPRRGSATATVTHPSNGAAETAHPMAHPGHDSASASATAPHPPQPPQDEPPCVGAIGGILRRLRDPQLIRLDWEATLRSVARVRTAKTQASSWPRHRHQATDASATGALTASVLFPAGARAQPRWTDHERAHNDTHQQWRRTWSPDRTPVPAVVGCTWDNGCCQRHRKTRACATSTRASTPAAALPPTAQPQPHTYRTT